MENIGPFKIECTEPYPVWITLEYENKELRFSHYDLPYLEFAIQQLKAAAAQKLIRARNGKKDDLLALGIFQ